MSEKIIQLNEAAIKGELRELVKNSVEETLNALLEHEADFSSQRLQIPLLYVDAVHVDVSGGRVVETRDQVHEGGFAGSGRADHGHSLALLHLK